MRHKSDDSSDRLLHDGPACAGDAFLKPLVEERQAFVVEAHEVQNRGVQVGDVTRFVHGGEAQLVRRADRLPSSTSG